MAGLAWREACNKCLLFKRCTIGFLVAQKFLRCCTFRSGKRSSFRERGENIEKRQGFSTCLVLFFVFWLERRDRKSFVLTKLNKTTEVSEADYRNHLLSRSNKAKAKLRQEVKKVEKTVRIQED
ncbi:hypothetical protein CEXT_688091 [Caerostris extrusa]|uniref:Uncharacterized protein n=1 Tax=Caerostris extrusa TaxID=172846 RepID=A0AAV4QU94_CAEEX|nr:hypothetical protein CEXT_688091 [Caerostris extrusa]